MTISEQPFECVPENTADPLPEGVSRLSGPERIATAIEISRESCPDGGANAVGRSTTRSRHEVVTA